MTPEAFSLSFQMDGHPGQGFHAEPFLRKVAKSKPGLGGRIGLIAGLSERNLFPLPGDGSLFRLKHGLGHAHLRVLPKDDVLLFAFGVAIPKEPDFSGHALVQSYPKTQAASNGNQMGLAGNACQLP